MKKLILSLLFIGQLTFAQDENILDNIIDDAKSLINTVDLDNIIPEYQYEVGVLYIRNSTMGKAPARRVNEKGMVYYYFLSSNDGDIRLNNIPNAIKKWNLLLGGEGNEMKLISDKLNEGWEIINMEQSYTSVSVSGTSLGPAANGWIVHFKRKIKK